MKKTPEPLGRIANELKSGQNLNSHLCFITRHLKPGVSKAAKALEKYSFQLSDVDTDKDLQQMFLESARQHVVASIDSGELETAEYEAIDDDLPKIRTYDILNRAIPFREIILAQTSNRSQSITDVSAFLQHEEIWAYCVRIDRGRTPVCLTFTRLFKSRIAVDEKANPESPWHSKYLKATFNVKAGQLELLKGDSINFDRRVDCVYSFDSGQIYVFNKANFEKIVSLEEEFRDVAQAVVEKLKRAAIIEGLDHVADSLEADTALHRRLHKLAKTIEGQKLDAKRVTKMAATIREFKLELQVTNGRVQVRSKQDLDEVIRLLEDYYLKSDQTGNKYGATAKKRL